MELRELFAAQAHKQWTGWMRYLFKQGRFNSDGSFTIDAEHAERWTRQRYTRYSNLSPEEQRSDQSEADQYLAILRDWFISMAPERRSVPENDKEV